MRVGCEMVTALLRSRAVHVMALVEGHHCCCPPYACHLWVRWALNISMEGVVDAVNNNRGWRGGNF